MFKIVWLIAYAQKYKNPKHSTDISLLMGSNYTHMIQESWYHCWIKTVGLWQSKQSSIRKGPTKLDEQWINHCARHQVTCATENNHMCSIMIAPWSLGYLGCRFNCNYCHELYETISWSDCISPASQIYNQCDCQANDGQQAANLTDEIKGLR